MGRRMWLVATAAVLVLVVAAAPALASAMRTWLVPSQRLGYYGEDCSLKASVDTTANPGDRVEFQTYDEQDEAWVKYEEQVVEETGTVDPLWIRFDETHQYPVRFRAIYRAVASGLTTGPISPVVTLNKLRYPITLTRVALPASPVAGKSYTGRVTVTPNPGPGKAVVTIYRKSGGVFVYSSTKNVTIDEFGEGSFKFSPRVSTTYKLRTRFYGNRFAVGSKTTNYVKVR